MLIRSVTDNDLQKAKAFIKAYLTNETSQCNQYFKNSILTKLNTPSNNLVELPHNVKGMLTMEDVSVSFDEPRYVLTDSDSKIVNQVLDIRNMSGTLSEYGIRYLNSLLLSGESGCGKTMLGRYIAYKSGLPFAYVNFSHLISSYLGSTGKNIKEVFDYVSKIKCVFMLDEVDAIGKERGGVQEVGEMSRIVINLMQAMDTLENQSIVIGATNRADIIDAALDRRFSIKHEMCLPTYDVRKMILKKYLDSIPNASYIDINLEDFANLTDGYSCAKITNSIINGVVKCLVGKESITGSKVVQYLGYTKN